MLPPGLATRCWEQNLDAMSVLSSRGVCLLSPDNTQAILTHWPGVAQDLGQLLSGSGTDGRARPPWAITDVTQCAQRVARVLARATDTSAYSSWLLD
jgi:hypothetical protein